MFSTSFYRVYFIVLLIAVSNHTTQAQRGLASDPRVYEEMSPMEIVTFLLSSENAYKVLFSQRPSEEDLATLINMVVASGQVGFGFLLQEARRASREDLMMYTALFSSFRLAENINTNALIDFIDRKGMEASNYDDVAALYPLISNLGFFPEREGMVEAFLMELAADAEGVTGNWAVMRRPTTTGQFNASRKAGLIQGLRSTAITALFHKNTESTLNFLEELRQNAPVGSYLRSMLDFHFDILEEFPVLEDYLCYVNQRKGIFD